MNKLKKLVNICTVVCLVVLSSCSKDDTEDMNPVLLSGEIPESLKMESYIYFIATDLKGSLLGVDSVYKHGTINITRPSGFTGDRYNLYYVIDYSDEWLNEKYWSIAELRETKISEFRPTLEILKDDLDSIGSKTIDFSNVPSGLTQGNLSYGFDDATTFRSNSGDLEIPIYSNTNNDVYYSMALDGTYYYNYLALPEEAGPHQLSFNISDLEEAREHAIRLNPETSFNQLEVYAIGPSGYPDWTRRVFYSNYRSISDQLLVYLPKSADWIDKFHTEINFNYDNTFHVYGYVGEVPASIDIIDDLSVEYDSINGVTTTGEFDFSYLNLSYYNEDFDADNSVEIFHTIIVENPENQPYDLPESVSSVLVPIMGTTLVDKLEEEKALESVILGRASSFDDFLNAALEEDGEGSLSMKTVHFYPPYDADSRKPVRRRRSFGLFPTDRY